MSNEDVHSVKLTKAGYFTIPQQMRDPFTDDYAIIGKDILKGCLVLYSKRSWLLYYDRFMQNLNLFNKEHNAFLREFLSYHKKIAISNHRVRIPKK